MKLVTCHQCGNQVAADQIRCPRCNVLLLRPCNGKCSQCQHRGACG